MASKEEIKRTRESLAEWSKEWGDLSLRAMEQALMAQERGDRRYNDILRLRSADAGPKAGAA